MVFCCDRGTQSNKLSLTRTFCSLFADSQMPWRPFLLVCGWLNEELGRAQPCLLGAQPVQDNWC